MFKKAFGPEAFPAVLVAQALASIQSRDKEHADNPRMLKSHKLRDIDCNIEQTDMIISGLVNMFDGEKYSVDDMGEGFEYMFYDLAGRCAKADLTLDFIQTIYASTGADQDKSNTYVDPVEGAIDNFGQALGHYLIGDDGTAFSRLLQGMRYMYDVDGFDSGWVARYFNEEPEDIGG